MKFSMRTYVAYSIGCLVAWAIVLSIVGFTGSSHKKHDVLLVFLGWAIGWVSATIARYFYPPPKNRKYVDAAPS